MVALRGEVPWETQTQFPQFTQEAYWRLFGNSPVFGNPQNAQQYYDAIINESQRAGLAPAFVAGIIAHETGAGRGYHPTTGAAEALVRHNNPGGLMSGNRHLDFPDLAAGIRATAENVHNVWARAVAAGNPTLQAFREIWAPSGASNDARNLNQFWVSGTEHYLGRIGNASLPWASPEQLGWHIPQALGEGAPGYAVGAGSWATPEQMQQIIQNAPQNFNWNNQEFINPALKQDETGWYFDTSALSAPGSLSALQGSYLQSVGLLRPEWGYDLGSSTWQNTGGVGGWSLMDTSNPDVIESGLFQQWLPKGFQAAGPEVWEQTPLQFWAPSDRANLFGTESTGVQAGGAGFDLFNPQGQFDVNMLNAPGAVSPELGGWLQQQGIINPSKGYNPVDQVWQDAPPAPGWQLINTTNVDPVYQQQITQQMSSLFPMGHFDNIFEGTGANPWSGPPVQNWLPPPAPGSSYHFGMVPGTSSSSTIAPGSGFGVIEGAEGLGYQGSAGITTIDPGILGLGAAINANALAMIQQGNATAAYNNALGNQMIANGVFTGVPLDPFLSPNFGTPVYAASPFGPATNSGLVMAPG